MGILNIEGGLIGIRAIHSYFDTEITYIKILMGNWKSEKY